MSDQSASNRVLWDSEVDYPDLSEHLRDGLRAIKDPELGMDIIQLGLVRNVTLTGESAVIKILLTTPFCPYGPELLEQTRVKAEELLEKPVRMDLSFEPWDFSMVEDGAAPEWGLYG